MIEQHRFFCSAIETTKGVTRTGVLVDQMEGFSSLSGEQEHNIEAGGEEVE